MNEGILDELVVVGLPVEPLVVGKLDESDGAFVNRA